MAEKSNCTGTDELVRRFRYRQPNADQIERIQQLRTAVLDLGILIDRVCPSSREKSDALTNLDYVLSQSCASIIRREY